MLFKKHSLKDKITCGQVYEREMIVSTREEARVLSISDDTQGIPHVRFERTLVGSSFKNHQGIRVLALNAFVRDFHVTG
jgi:hypothetical protein